MGRLMVAVVDFPRSLCSPVDSDLRFGYPCIGLRHVVPSSPQVTVLLNSALSLTQEAAMLQGHRALTVLTGLLSAVLVLSGAVFASDPGVGSSDESVFVKTLSADQHEALLYAWTRDVDGKDSDFLAVVDVRPGSPTYGKVVSTVSTGSAANEAHHFGYTANADRIFAGGLFSNQLFIYDLKVNPRQPKLVRTVDLDATGYSGPHTLYAVPDGVMIAMLGAADGGAPGGLVKLDDDGHFIEGIPAASHEGPPVYMYDVGAKPELNRMVTSSWAHPQHIKQQGGAPPEHVGDAVLVWDYRAKKILQVEHLDAAPLEVRWMHGPSGLGGFINCAYASTIWYWEDRDGDGALEFTRVIELPEGSAPADMRISYDNKLLYISLFGGNAVHQYDVTDPLKPKLVSTVGLPHPNMMKLAPDSRRLYVTNSLLSTMDPADTFGAFLLHVGPDGMRVDDVFRPDFSSFPTGPAGPHDMLLK